MIIDNKLRKIYNYSSNYHESRIIEKKIYHNNEFTFTETIDFSRKSVHNEFAIKKDFLAWMLLYNGPNLGKVLIR